MSQRSRRAGVRCSAWQPEAMRVCMFVYNNCARDMRVLKEAWSLLDAGHEVRIVAVLDATTQVEEVRGGVRILRIDRNPIHYRLLKRVRQLRRLGRYGAHAGVKALGVVGGSAALADRLEARLRRAAGGRRVASAPLVLVLPLRPLLHAAERIAMRGEARFAEGPSGTPRRPGLGRRSLMRFHKPLMFTDYYRRALKVTAAEPADAYHAHDLHTLPAAALAARRDRATLVYDAHELYPEMSTLSARESRIWRVVERALIGRADHVITVCESIADELSARYRIAKPTVLLNCPPRPQITSDRDSDPLRERIDLADRTVPIVLYQGGFTANRGLPQLVRAGGLLEQGVLVLMGWGQLEDELRRIIAEHRLEERVLITPAVPPSELLEFSAGADIGVIPYEPVGLNNTYTTPNKLFDYIAVGLPVAASPLPELRRFVEGLGLGSTFASIDEAGIAATINAMLGDPERMHSMREAALRAAPSLSWEVEAEKLLAVYASCRTPRRVQVRLAQRDTAAVPEAG
jgi:glycosyltransferase involved in cell wall biosynthesis